MLIIARKAGRAVQLTLSDLVDPNATIGAIFPDDSDITVTACHLTQGSIKIAIDAPESLAVMHMN